MKHRRPRRSTAPPPAPGTPRAASGWSTPSRRLTAVDQLRVVSTTPTNGQTLGSAPSSITIQLLQADRPDDASRPTRPDLPVTSRRASRSASARRRSSAQPDRLVPDHRRRHLTSPPTINGAFVFQLADGSITAIDGSQLDRPQPPRSPSPTWSAPTVTEHDLPGPDHRHRVQRGDAAQRRSPRDNIQLVRTGGTGQFGQPAERRRHRRPAGPALLRPGRTTGRSTTSATCRSRLLPSDIYALVVTDDVRDVGRQPARRRVQRATSRRATARPAAPSSQQLGGRLVAGAADHQLRPGGRLRHRHRRRPATPTRSARPSPATSWPPFPATNAGLQVAIQFIQAHPGGFDLGVGPNGQGFVGNPDLIITTDANGSFSFQPPFDLRDGFQRVRIVVVGEAGQPAAAGPGDAARPVLPGRHDQPAGHGQLDPAGRADRQPAQHHPELRRPGRAGRPERPAGRPAAARLPGARPGDGEQPEQLLADQPRARPGPGHAPTTSTSRSFISSGDLRLDLDPDPADRPLHRPGRAVLHRRAALGPLRPGRPDARARLLPGIRDAAGNPLDNDPAHARQPELLHLLRPAARAGLHHRLHRPSAPRPSTRGRTATSGPRAYYETPVPGFTPRAEAPPERLPHRLLQHPGAPRLHQRHPADPLGRLRRRPLPTATSASAAAARRRSRA